MSFILFCDSFLRLVECPIVLFLSPVLYLLTRVFFFQPYLSVPDCLVGYQPFKYFFLCIHLPTSSSCLRQINKWMLYLPLVFSQLFPAFIPTNADYDTDIDFIIASHDGTFCSQFESLFDLYGQLTYLAHVLR